jgi:hypothetical protein
LWKEWKEEEGHADAARQIATRLCRLHPHRLERGDVTVRLPPVILNRTLPRFPYFRHRDCFFTGR